MGSTAPGKRQAVRQWKLLDFISVTLMAALLLLFMLIFTSLGDSLAASGQRYLDESSRADTTSSGKITWTTPHFQFTSLTHIRKLSAGKSFLPHPLMAILSIAMQDARDIHIDTTVLWICCICLRLMYDLCDYYWHGVWLAWLMPWLLTWCVTTGFTV